MVTGFVSRSGLPSVGRRSLAMLSAVAGGASTMLGVVGVGLAAIDAVATGNREDVIRKQLHLDVCGKMDSYERERNAAANRRGCCMGLLQWILMLGALAELPVRWVFHSVMYALFAFLATIWWPLFIINPSEVGCLANGWTFCLLQMAHHQVHFNLYLMAFTTLCSALCNSWSMPWFLQHNLDLLRPSHPLVSRLLTDHCGCCAPCTRGVKQTLRDYEVVLDPQQAAARYFRSMFFFLSGCPSLHPALVCGRCCACCRENYTGPMERLQGWGQERKREREENTRRFYMEVYGVSSYEELEERQVGAYREQVARQAAEAAARPSAADVARTAVGILTAQNGNGIIQRASNAVSYAASGGMLPVDQSVQPTAPQADEEEGNAKKSVANGGAKPSVQTPAAPGLKRGLMGGLVSLATGAVSVALEKGQEAMAARAAAQANASGGGAVAVAEAVEVVEDGQGGTHSDVPMAKVETVDEKNGSGGQGKKL